MLSEAAAYNPPQSQRWNTNSTDQSIDNVTNPWNCQGPIAEQLPSQNQLRVLCPNRPYKHNPEPGGPGQVAWGALYFSLAFILTTFQSSGAKTLYCVADMAQKSAKKWDMLYFAEDASIKTEGAYNIV
ncbi:hypothetical protein CLAFUW4_04094 [Fulvia fulva]|uniref:Uncharacterized protein n=1 Tax=Passalora fulva TaxID=5499 RepID=A0A9Q8LF40_PASFU|nr:uncharacterized protein CLAFUR5_04057 [Fulvia fulva]KAK4626700.1 hypothetical protein CLAFUR4_04080 [Fulvia fulva]KAK4628429.1 hypothetical protein CLAFUR0_04081 [Fulvia fulva]UJO16059.1 hypothetical protein CLAFUR5_04057 [Fulvia fulva]WPV13126.1 hypothetical protein CLAFUW4_04094 [Fulvia fulva]WPV28089.1 hypothetical protein CLAFUW7_04083 [Fulvia fulva]